MEIMVSNTLFPLAPLERVLVPIELGVIWIPEAVWTF